MVLDQRFTFLKLDFLHAAALPAARHDPSLTRAQVQRELFIDNLLVRIHLIIVMISAQVHPPTSHLLYYSQA